MLTGCPRIHLTKLNYEKIFGHLKYILGYKSFLLRGVEKVRAEFRLICIGWDLKKRFKMGIKSARV